MRLIEKAQGLYVKYDKLQDEKRELIEKLFFMQENFIRKLDQQIEKTEEDKNVQERCLELGNDDDLIPSLNKKLDLKSNKLSLSSYRKKLNARKHIPEFFW